MIREISLKKHRVGKGARPLSGAGPKPGGKHTKGAARTMARSARGESLSTNAKGKKGHVEQE